MFILIWEREEGGERETSIWEKNIDWLLPICTPAGDQNHNLVCALTSNRNLNLLVYGTMLQPTQPPDQGYFSYTFSSSHFAINDL